MQDLIINIGESFYPDIEDFIEEARTMGISRKLPFLPNGFETGKTRCFIMHKAGTKRRRLVGFFIIDGLEVVVEDKRALEDKAREFVELGAMPISMAEIKSEPLRGCGYRKPGGVYIVQHLTPEQVLEIAELSDLKKDIFAKGKLVVFPKPFPVAGTEHFRGFKLIDGDQLIGDLQTGDYKGSINHYAIVEEGAKMTFSEFTQHVAKETGHTIAQTDRILRESARLIQDVVVSGDDVTIPGLGRFLPRERSPRAERKVHNIHTGEEILVPAQPAYMYPAFRPAGSFKEVMKIHGKSPINQSSEQDGDGGSGIEGDFGDDSPATMEAGQG